MAQCEAKIKSGRRCHNLVRGNSRFCHVHVERTDGKSLGMAALGAAVGNLIAPGIGGIIAGAATGYLASNYLRKETGMKKRVFVSFDFDNDKKLKDSIIGQSKLGDSPFDVTDHSLKEAAPERNWEEKARQAISRAEIVLVMVGPKTYQASGVLKEVEMARDLEKQIVQIIGYKDGDYTAVPNAGRPYRWSWDNLKKLLA